MPTIKKRINITISRDDDRALPLLALRDQKPEATKASELLRLALEIEEDRALGAIAARRDTPRAKFLTHRQVWR